MFSSERIKSNISERSERSERGEQSDKSDRSVRSASNNSYNNNNSNTFKCGICSTVQSYRPSQDKFSNIQWCIQCKKQTFKSV